MLEIDQPERVFENKSCEFGRDNSGEESEKSRQCSIKESQESLSNTVHTQTTIDAIQKLALWRIRKSCTEASEITNSVVAKAYAHPFKEKQLKERNPEMHTQTRARALQTRMRTHESTERGSQAKTQRTIHNPFSLTVASCCKFVLECMRTRRRHACAHTQARGGGQREECNAHSRLHFA